MNTIMSWRSACTNLCQRAKKHRLSATPRQRNGAYIGKVFDSCVSPDQNLPCRTVDEPGNRDVVVVFQGGNHVSKCKVKGFQLFRPDGYIKGPPVSAQDLHGGDAFYAHQPSRKVVTHNVTQGNRAPRTENNIPANLLKGGTNIFKPGHRPPGQDAGEPGDPGLNELPGIADGCSPTELDGHLGNTFHGGRGYPIDPGDTPHFILDGSRNKEFHVFRRGRGNMGDDIDHGNRELWEKINRHMREGEETTDPQDDGKENSRKGILNDKT